jgi:hypothetical protein
MKDKFKVKEDSTYEYFIAPITIDDVMVIDSYISTYKLKRMINSKLEIISQFKNLYGMHIENIITYGDVNIVTHHGLKTVIESKTFIHKLGEGINTIITAYKCFNTNSDYRIGITPIHSDSLSSWQCLLNKISNPKFTIVYKIEKNGKK